MRYKNSSSCPCWLVLLMMTTTTTEAATTIATLPHRPTSSTGSCSSENPSLDVACCVYCCGCCGCCWLVCERERLTLLQQSKNYRILCCLRAVVSVCVCVCVSIFGARCFVLFCFVLFCRRIQNVFLRVQYFDRRKPTCRKQARRKVGKLETFLPSLLLLARWWSPVSVHPAVVSSIHDCTEQIVSREDRG